MIPINSRWLVFCKVPAYCDSLKHYEVTQIFGRHFLKSVFPYIQRQIMDQFHQERERMPKEQRVMILSHFPPFLDQLNEEVFSPNSKIWEAEVKPLATNQLQSLLESKKSK